MQIQKDPHIKLFGNIYSVYSGIKNTHLPYSRRRTFDKQSLSIVDSDEVQTVKDIFIHVSACVVIAGATEV